MNRQGNNGFTLIEVILVVIIAGILATVALRSGGAIYDAARTEETKQEFDALAVAMVGNAQLQNNGVRSHFGYVGDVGSMPPDLDALYANPGAYATWKGPYIDNRYTQKTDDYKKDAWGSFYSYSGVNVTSTGSGSDIVRKLGKSVTDFTLNQVTGVVLDLDGTPPGMVYRDSVQVRLTVPDGVGGTTVKTSFTDVGGYFSFDSVPIGNHELDVVEMMTPDTLWRFVSVLPGSRPHSEYRLMENLWFAAETGGIPNLVGHYPLDEGSGQVAHDFSGLALDANLQNDPAGSGWAVGKISGAFDFDGADDYFETGVSATELQLTDDYSLSVWIYAEPSQNTWAAIICKCTPTGNDNHWTLQWNNAGGSSKRLILYHPGGSNWTSTYTLADAASAWHHIVLTYRHSPARVQLYIDGAFHSESSSLTQGPGSGSGKFRIGCDRATYRWHGKIDDVRIYDRVLTTGEIETLYNMGS